MIKMTFSKTILAAFLLVVVVASPVDKRSRSSPIEIVSIFNLEDPCVRQGGLCLRIEDCQPENLVQMRGVMCPAQHHLGVECCYAQ